MNLICFIFSFLFFQNLNSYIDPGSGSFLIQILIAFFAGALYLVKVFWIQIKTFFINILGFIKKLFVR